LATTPIVRARSARQHDFAKDLLRIRKAPVPILESTPTSVNQPTSAQGETPMFTRRFTTSVAGTVLAAAALSLGALGFAASASASSADNAFLAQLQADGITPPSAARAVSDAHAVCTALDQGQTAQEVINAVAKSTGLSAKGAKTFAIDAASAYCPQYVTQS
jgi:pyridoxal biosynthesis lyase PdxS